VRPLIISQACTKRPHWISPDIKPVVCLAPAVGLAFLDNDLHFLDSHLRICALDRN
jgi:hypothetical protein